MDNFSISRLPELIFGAGNIKRLPEILTHKAYNKVLIITGGRSFTKSDYWQSLIDSLNEPGIKYYHYRSTGESSPEIVDSIVLDLKNIDIDTVIAIGGGTVMDTGKAVSAMLCMPGSVVDYLEGVGIKEPTGIRKPLICIPTTSGTGSEATKNAVITKVGAKGFKKSLRHKGYIPDTVIIDPELIKNCPEAITVASGLDAITQLLESYVSTKATPFTDTLALQGLKLAGASLPRLVQDPEDLNARADMAYAAYLSGITLANAGLGVVHGAASVLGSIRSIPHGVVCGTLLGAATEKIIDKLNKSKYPGEQISLKKFSDAGTALTGNKINNIEEGCQSLINTLNNWVSNYDIPRLGAYGFTEKDIIESSKSTGIKNTPYDLDKEDILSIFLERL